MRVTICHACGVRRWSGLGPCAVCGAGPQASREEAERVYEAAKAYVETLRPQWHVVQPSGSRLPEQEDQ